MFIVYSEMHDVLAFSGLGLLVVGGRHNHTHSKKGRRSNMHIFIHQFLHTDFPKSNHPIPRTLIRINKAHILKS
jgi:hypothetical protein